MLYGGRLRDVGDGASAGLWGCSVVGAAAAVHPWGPVSSSSLLEVHQWRLPTRWQRCWRKHISGTLVGALSGRWVVAAYPWVGGGVKQQSRRVGKRKTMGNMGWKRPGGWGGQDNKTTNHQRER